MTTYIHETLEVELTGRTATKQRVRKSRTKNNTIIIHEVKATDPKIDFVSWVSLDDLFKVLD